MCVSECVCDWNIVQEINVFTYTEIVKLLLSLMLTFIIFINAKIGIIRLCDYIKKLILDTDLTLD